MKEWTELLFKEDPNKIYAVLRIAAQALNSKYESVEVN
jgi:hypothetical protein